MKPMARARRNYHCNRWQWIFLGEVCAGAFVYSLVVGAIVPTVLYGLMAVYSGACAVGED
jgi:hypothetical protein